MPGTTTVGGAAQYSVGDGANQAISPDQLQWVLGHEQVQAMSSQSGMAPNDFLSQLSQHLPNTVNATTPNGRLPDEGSVSAWLHAQPHPATLVAASLLTWQCAPLSARAENKMGYLTVTL